MRVSRIQAAENRQTVINVASRLFRERGFDGIGLKDLMEGAGLTQGAFYKQFESKEDLAAQASRRALESASQRWSTAIAENPDDPLGAVIAFYLSPLLPQTDGEDTNGKAMVVLSTMVGAMTLSRAVNDPAFAQAFLNAAVEHVREAAAA